MVSAFKSKLSAVFYCAVFIQEHKILLRCRLYYRSTWLWELAESLDEILSKARAKREKRLKRVQTLALVWPKNLLRSRRLSFALEEFESAQSFIGVYRSMRILDCRTCLSLTLKHPYGLSFSLIELELSSTLVLV